MPVHKSNKMHMYLMGAQKYSCPCVFICSFFFCVVGCYLHCTESDDSFVQLKRSEVVSDSARGKKSQYRTSYGMFIR